MKKKASLYWQGWKKAVSLTGSLVWGREFRQISLSEERRLTVAKIDELNIHLKNVEKAIDEMQRHLRLANAIFDTVRGHKSEPHGCFEDQA